MHFTALIAVVALALSVKAGNETATPKAQANECGNLGVLTAPSVLPEGVDPSALRPCAEHPLNLNNVTTNANAAPKADACFFGDPYGCTRGYCWKACNTPGSGQWCCTAWNNGFGRWRTCSGKEDCAPAPAADCGQGCPRCGCGC